MIAIDSIGLGPTEVWASRSDKRAVEILAGAARVTKLPLAGVNMNGAGVSDEEPFLQQSVRTITIHSLTNENIGVLHSWRDVRSAISFHDYYDTYRLLAAYLALLDKVLDGGTKT